MMYVGAYFLIKKSSNFIKHLGFAMIFAQLPFQRMVSPFFKMNDEFYATSLLYGNTTFIYWVVIITIWIICIPPLIKAYLSIKNKYRMIWFLFYLVLFPYLLWGPIFGTLEFIMVERNFLAQPIIGIGLLFIINEVITIIAYFLTKKYIDPNHK